MEKEQIELEKSQIKKQKRKKVLISVGLIVGSIIAIILCLPYSILLGGAF